MDAAEGAMQWNERGQRSSRQQRQEDGYCGMGALRPITSISTA